MRYEGEEGALTETTVTIAGIDLSFLYDEDRTEPGVGENTHPDKETEGIKLHVHYGPLPQIKPEEIIFDSGQTWAFFRTGHQYVFQNNSLDPDSSPDVFVVLNPNLISGDIYLDHDPSFGRELSDPLGWPLNQILMIYLLSLNRGILFHACGIDDQGNGYLFLGNSGHGKTTMANLWKKNQCAVLNDDRIVVREKGDRLWMYGTPWHGDLAEWSLQGLPIHKIFFLNRGGKNSAVPKNGVEAVSMLIGRSFPPFWDKKSMSYTMNLCHRLVDKIPCHELRFEPDNKIVGFVRGMPHRSAGQRG